MSDIRSSGAAASPYDRSLADEPEEWYRSLFTHSLDGILLTSPDGSILAANPAICRMLGYEEAEIRVLGRNGLLDQGDPRLALALDQREATGVFSGRLTAIAKDGRRIPVDVSSRVFRDDAGNARTSTFLRDASERLRAEELLRQSELRFRVALASSPITVYMTDAELRYTWMYNVHPSYRVEDLLGKRDDEVASPADIAELMALKREVLSTGKGIRREVRVAVRGEVRYYDLTAEPTRDANGAVSGLTVAATDITERWHRERERAELLELTTRAHEAAERAKERATLLAAVSRELAEMLDHEQSLGVVARLLVDRLATLCLADIVDDDGAVRRIQAVHSDPARQSLADSLRSISFAPGRRHLAESALRAGVPELSPRLSVEDLGMFAQDAGNLAVLRALRVSSRMSLPLVARARTLGAITLLRDDTREPFDASDFALGIEIAQRAALAVDNALLFRRARRATELRDETLGIVSHDLRTPLAAIAMALAPLELEQPVSAESLAVLVKVAGQSIDSMTRMIRDLLDVASIDAGKLSMERGPTA